jgi:hypothetical protein
MAVFHVEDRHAPRILITERLAEVGVDLLRRELPEARVDPRFGLAPAPSQEGPSVVFSSCFGNALVSYAALSSLNSLPSKSIRVGAAAAREAPLHPACSRRETS